MKNVHTKGDDDSLIVLYFQQNIVPSEEAVNIYVLKRFFSPENRRTICMMKSMTIHTVSQPTRRMNFMRKFDHMASKIFPEESYSEQQYTTMAQYM